MTTIMAPEPTFTRASAHPALARRPHRAAQRSPFREVREQARQRALMIIATTTGIFSVTAAALAAIALGLGS